jgi:UV DNA damage endonuclease
MRLGFAVKVLGREGLKSNDARRWQNAPHLRISIEYAHAIFDYLADAKISMYRLSSDFAPYYTHPDLPQFHNQIQECKTELQTLGKRAGEMNLRLSFHPSQYILLNSPNPKITQTAIKDFQAQAEMLDVMGQGEEGVVVTHVGGVYGDRAAAMQRFIDNHKTLPEAAKRRLVLENDDMSWSAGEVLKIHEATGIRCIFDHQHHNCFNPDERDAAQECAAFLKTWQGRGKPKIHFSSPRTEPRIIERKDKNTGKKVKVEAPPLATQHADYIDAETFVEFSRAVAKICGRKITPPFDVMCEAKAKDLAVLKLREDLQKRAPKFMLE